MSATALLERSAGEGSPTIPDELESANSKLVYLYLATANGGTVGELTTSLGMRNITLYPVLESLADRGLVANDGETYFLS